MAQLSIADVRAKFPQYDNLSDGELAGAIHQRFYSQMDRAEFNNLIGYAAVNRDVQAENRPAPSQSSSNPSAIPVPNDAIDDLSSMAEPVTPAAPTTPESPAIPQDVSVPEVSIMVNPVQQPAEIADRFVGQMAMENEIAQELASEIGKLPEGDPRRAGMQAALDRELQSLADLAVGQGVMEAAGRTPAPYVMNGPTEVQPDYFGEEEISETAKRRGQQFVRGATEVVASIPESLAIADRAMALEVSGGYKDQIEQSAGIIRELAAQIDQTPDNDPRRSNMIDTLKRETESITALMEGQAAVDDSYRVRTPAHERESFQRGDQVRQASTDTFGAPDPRDRGFWAQVAEGGGNMTGMIATSAMTGPAAPVTGVVTGSSMNEAQVYKEALQAGVSEEEALRASGYGALVGASEIIPITRALRLLPPRLRGKVSNQFYRRASDIAQSAGEEAAQEYLATVANNLIAQNIYDPKRGWNQGATDAALVGAFLGGSLGAVGTGVDAARNRQGQTTPQTPEQPQARSTAPTQTAPQPDTEVQTPAPVQAPQPQAAPEQPKAPEADPISELAEATKPVQPDQPASPLPVEGEASLNETQEAGEPKRDEFEAEARVDTITPSDWEKVPGEANGQRTGRDWMVHKETGEVLSVDDFNAKIAESPTGEGQVADQQGGLTNDPESNVPNGAVKPVKSDVSNDPDGGGLSATDGTKATEEQDGTTADQTAINAAPNGDTAPALDAGATRSPSGTVVSQQEEAAPVAPQPNEGDQGNALQGEARSAFDWLTSNGYKGAARNMELGGEDQRSAGVERARVLKSATDDKRDWPTVDENGVYDRSKVTGRNRFTLENPDEPDQALAQIDAMQVAPNDWIADAQVTVGDDRVTQSFNGPPFYPTREEAIKAAQDRAKDVAQQIVERGGAGVPDAELVLKWLGHSQTRKRQSDLIDAAQKSGKLEIVHVTAESEAKAKGNGDRTFDQAGAAWDAMTPDQRKAMLVEQKPLFKMYPNQIGKTPNQNWSDISPLVKSEITRNMPDDVYDMDRAAEVQNQTTGSQRDLAVAGKHWDGLKGGDRNKMLIEINPSSSANVRTKYIAYKWSELSKDLKERLAAAMPADVFKDSTTKEQPTNEQIDAAASEADPNPTDAQKEAENYKMGHIKWQGLDITIENAKGSIRSGKDADGKEWSVEMPAHYGKFRGTEGADGDHVDVYIGDDEGSDRVFVMDQTDLDGTFDEHKVFIRFKTGLSARGAHRKAFSDKRGTLRQGGFTELTVDGLKDWLANGDTTKPLDGKVEAKENIEAPDVEMSEAVKEVLNGFYEQFHSRAEKMRGSDGLEVGSEGKRAYIALFAVERVIAEMRKGKSAFDAGSVADRETRILIQNHNEKNPAPNMQIAEGAYSGIIDDMVDAVERADAPKEKATQDEPPVVTVKAGSENTTDASKDNDTDTDGQPTIKLAKRLRHALSDKSAMPKTNIALMKMAAEEFGGTVAEGAFSPKDAYDALELAVNMLVRDQAEAYDPSRGDAGAKAAVEGLQMIIDQMPTQTRRDSETDTFQQFSTPPTYGYVVNWIANIKGGERVLEPSAGNGGIAIFAKNGYAKVDVNELAERRLPSLEALGFDRVTGENAEQIANIWANDPTRSYDVVVMNPPFSSSAGRTSKNNSATGAKHIEQALAMLKPGGRLVAIMGHTFRESNSRVKPFFDKLAKGPYSVRANIVVKGDQIYKKYGTTYDNRLLVIDKIKDAGEMVTGEAETLADVIDMTKGIRDEASNRRTKDDADQQVIGDGDREISDGGVDDNGERGAGERERVSKPDDLEGAGDGQRRDGRSGDPDGSSDGASASKPETDGRVQSDRSASNGKRGRGSRGTSDGGRGSTATVSKIEAEKAEEDSGGFAKYRPARVKIKDAQEHPIALVESSAMASVNPPAPDYDLQIPPKMITNGLLSEAQIEQVLYAGAAHSQMLPAAPDDTPKRRGYYIGDGTGVGKTREIAGIVADNWAQGRKRHVLISKDKKLLKGARRDFDNIGMKSVPIVDGGTVKPTESIDRKQSGVMFYTYSTLGRTPKAGQKSRVEQIVEWLGPDFDGTITFDEAHLAGNAIPIKGKRGTSKPSASALAVMDLQQQLPNARIVYASATAATEVHNLAYADRLGLWGTGTPFPSVLSFVSQVDKGGVAAMEVVARDMKQMGIYMARSISFEGVEYDKVEHQLTENQRAMYDVAAEAWQLVLQRADEAIQDHTDGGGRQRGAAMAAFWSSHQRFFNQTLTSMQMPSVLKSIEKDMKDGLSPVVQIVNTNEAATKQALAKMDDGDSLDDIDITPRATLMQYLETSFPVHQYEDYEDENGNLRKRPVQDADGNFVQNREAVAMRDQLLDDLASIKLPGNPLDMLIEKFGADKVAEVTGRSTRIVTKDGNKVQESRSQNKTMAEAAEFQDGKRDLLIFSDAGGTGMDFHADKSAKNTRRRAHYVLQAGWRADRAIQGFGRTHRTNQAQAPIYRLAGTNLSGHKRFTSSIARRLDQLGALTKGQKDASGSTMFNATDNLENEFADRAVQALFYQIWGGRLEGFTVDDAARELGLNLVGENGFNVSKIPPVPQFLNRLLNTKIDRQNMLFDAFVEHMETAVQQAIEEGTYTSGVEAYDHDGAELVESKEAYRDENSEARSQYQMVKVQKKIVPMSWDEITNTWAKVKFKKSRDGEVYAFRPASSRTNDRGDVVQTYHKYSPIDHTIVDSPEYRFQHDAIEEADAKALWEKGIADAPKMREDTVHMVTGALLPIWDRLPTTSPRIIRMELDDGRTLLGRQIPDIELMRTLENLGVDAPDIDLTPVEIQSTILQGRTVILSSGHRIKRSKVGGDQRIEVIAPSELQFSEMRPGGNLERLGFQMEKSRAFVATGERGIPALEAFMTGKDIVNVTQENHQAKGDEPIKPYSEEITDAGIFKDLKGQMRKLGLGDVDLQIDPTLMHQGQVYTDFFGKVVLTIGDTLNPKWTLGHEAVHIYRHLGAFQGKEWDVLAAEAESKWLKRYDIEQRYPDLTREEQIEEAVAEAFGEGYQRGSGFRTTSPARAALRKIANFLKAVRNWAKGLGMKTPEDIIGAMARGEFAKRTKRRTPENWEDQTNRLLKDRRKPAKPNNMRGAIYLPDRYVFDTLLHGNGSIFDRIKGAKQALGDRMDFARTRIQDRFLPVLRAQQVIEREMKGKVPEELNAYLAEEMYSGRTGFKLDHIDHEYTTKIIKIISETNKMTAETAGRFLYARHAEERNAHIAKINPDMPDGGSGMSTAEARSIIDGIKASPEASAYQEIADLVDALREWSLQERVDMGLMTKDDANHWRKSYDAYVPLKGWAETDFADAELDITGIGRGYNVRGQESRRALGRSTEAFNPLIAAITQAQEVAVRSEKNRVGQHLYRLIRDMPAKEMWEVKKADTVKVFNENTGLVQERTVAPITLMQAANEMAVKVDGEEYRLIFNDPRLARAVTRVGVDGLGTITRPLSVFSRYISMVNTMLNPEFVITNFMRDTVTANINIQSKELGSKISKGMMKDAPKALRGAYRGLGGKKDTEWSKYFQEFSEAGGKVAFWTIENPEANQGLIEKRLRREGNGAKGLALGLVTPSVKLNPALSFMERINLAVDNAIRLSAFVNARKLGMSKQEAATLSKNLTVNFNRRGDHGSAINAAYVFANAAMQGTHIMFKALKHRKVQKIALGLMIMSFMLDQSNAYLSEEDEDGQLAYDKMPEHKNERSLIIMLGSDSGDALTLPMPYGYNVFTYMGNRLSKWQRGAITGKEAVGQTTKAALNSFSPINGNSFMSLVTPTILDPAVDIATNENWLGREIYPDYPNMTAPDSQRYFKSVSVASRVIAERLNSWTGGTYAESGLIDVSPETIDHVSGYLTGGTGRFAGRMTNLFAKAFGGEEAGEIEVNDIPFARTLYTETGEWVDRSNYYDRRQIIRAANNAAKAYEANGDPVPEQVAWRAALYDTLLQTERQRRGTSRVTKDEAAAYLRLNTAYVRAWKENTPYSSESIFDQVQ